MEKGLIEGTPKQKYSHEMPFCEMDHFLQPIPHRKAGKREGPIPKQYLLRNFLDWNYFCEEITSYCPFKVLE